MKDIFNQQTIDEFQTRIQKLNTGSKAQWGKMNVFQMLKHCTENDRMLLRERKYKRLFIGRLFGKLALKSNIKNDAPLGKNSPTHPELVIKENGDVTTQKQLWLNILNKYAAKRSSEYTDFVHPFFGKMDSTQVSKFAYKHIDHHLRQFGV